MRNGLFTAVLLTAMVVGFNSCKRCYTCKNECRFCYEQQADTILRQQFCSDKLTYEYYDLYTDSLRALGWVCNDTSYTAGEEICAGKRKIDDQVREKEAKGFRCWEK